MPVLALVVDPLPLSVVVGGAFGIAALQTGAATFFPALSALRPLFGARPDADRDRARAIAHSIARKIAREGLPRAERINAPPGFVADALARIADCGMDIVDVEAFAHWAGQVVDDRAARHARIIAFWDAIADAAPAMGMTGTVLGLIAMFAGMNDPANIGPAMALALFTTFYGIILANMVAGPIARRLDDLSAREIAWQRAFAHRLEAIARREMPATMPTVATRHRPAVREAA